MNGRQSRTLQALRRVSDFVAMQTESGIPHPPLLAQMHHQLDRSIERIAKLGITQRTVKSMPGSMVHAEQLRRRIRRERMMPLIKVAKPLLKFAPGTAAALRVPHARASTTDVATAAVRLADVLKRHSKLLSSAGYSKQFIQEMRDEARQLASATRQNERVRQRQSQATRALAAEFQKAAKSVTVIEGILTPRLAAEPSLEATWRNARRVTARTGRPTDRTRQRRALRLERVQSVAS